MLSVQHRVPRCRCRRGRLLTSAAVTTAVALTAAGSANAMGNLLLLDKPPAQTTIAAGPSLWVLPTYPGARGARTTLLPGVDVETPSGLFLSTDSGVGWNLSKRDDVQAGVRLWPQFGRRTRDVPGLDRIGTRLQAELFANVQVLPVLLLQSGLLHGAGRNQNGDQLELGLTSGLPLGDGGDILGIGLATTYANRNYRQSYFGVSAREAGASGLPATSLGGGWHDASLTFSAEHKFETHWKLSGQLIAGRLLGEAARSPLAQSRTQTAATLTLWYQF